VQQVPQEAAPQPVQQVPQEAPQPVPQEAPQPVQQVPQEAPQPVQQVTPATTPAVAATPAPVRHQPQPVGEEIDGLEDVDASDLSMPRLQIVHEDAVWEDSLSNERFESLDVILLGLIKQRVLWPSEMGEESSAPLCKSYNHTQGFPGEGFTVQAKGDPM